MRSFVIGAALFGILALSVYFAIVAWVDLGEVSLGWFGWLTLVLGSVMTVALGGGLMALVFYSARQGHDEAHYDQSVFRRPEPDETPAAEAAPEESPPGEPASGERTDRRG
jgi:hypothetical protein